MLISGKGYTNLVFPDCEPAWSIRFWHVDGCPALLFTRFVLRVCHPAFSKRDFKNALGYEKWAERWNEHVRRLASEGSRPRLPWSFQLPAVIENPAIPYPFFRLWYLMIHLYVNKSVANHPTTFQKRSSWFGNSICKTNFGKKRPPTNWLNTHVEPC